MVKGHAVIPWNATARQGPLPLKHRLVVGPGNSSTDVSSVALPSTQKNARVSIGRGLANSKRPKMHEGCFCQQDGGKMTSC